MLGSDKSFQLTPFSGGVYVPDGAGSHNLAKISAHSPSVGIAGGFQTTVGPGSASHIVFKSILNLA